MRDLASDVGKLLNAFINLLLKLGEGGFGFAQLTAAPKFFQFGGGVSDRIGADHSGGAFEQVGELRALLGAVPGEAMPYVGQNRGRLPL